jgi:type VI secretion system protein ImpM
MADCGFYGKIPSEGDFVSRRLPWAFTSAWDDWLQRGLLASREALGPGWLARYLSAPIWRFELAPGVCGPLGWRGVFFASVDRVGRYFPLTVAFAHAASGPAGVSGVQALAADDAAWLAIEDAALAGLDPALGVDAFDRLIDALAAPAAAAASASASARVCLYTHGSAETPATGFTFDALPPAAQFAHLIAPPMAAPQDTAPSASSASLPDAP